MSLIDGLTSKLVQLDGKAHYFVGSIALLGTLLIGSSVVAWQSSREQQRLVAANVDTIRILRTANAVKLETLNTLRGERGYLLTGDSAYLKPYLEGREAIAKSLDELEQVARKQSDGEDDVTHLRAAVASYLAQIGSTVSLARSGQTKLAIGQVRRGLSGFPCAGGRLIIRPPWL